MSKLKLPKEEVKKIICEEKRKILGEDEEDVKDMIERAKQDMEEHKTLEKEAAYALAQKDETDKLDSLIKARKQYVDALEKIKRNID